MTIIDKSAIPCPDGFHLQDKDGQRAYVKSYDNGRYTVLTNASGLLLPVKEVMIGTYDSEGFQLGVNLCDALDLDRMIRAHAERYGGER